MDRPATRLPSRVLGRCLIATALMAAFAAVSTAGTAAQGRASDLTSSGVQSAGDWTTYHYDQSRSGYDAAAAQASGQLSSDWATTLDGAVYGEPLVVGDTIIAVTENDTIYGLSLDGNVLWSTHVGSPVPLSELPCGNIDPLGITGTPIYDAKKRLVFFVAELDNPIRHELYAVSPVDGSIAWTRSADPEGMIVTPTQERGALAIAQGRVWVPYGGLAGDCGPYHGWVVGTPLSGTGKLAVYQQPSAREAGIWAPPGPSVDANGNLYVAVGNGASLAKPYDDSDSVIELSGTDATKLSLFAPKSWAEENANDLDLGSTGPPLFHAIGKDWTFGIGKAGDGYLLRQGHLGGIGGYVAKITGCKSWGGTAYHADVLYLPCLAGLSAYQISKGASGPTLHRLWRNSDAEYGAAPVMGGGAVWAIDTGRLLEFDPANGATVAQITVGSCPHFATPTLHGSLVIMGTLAGVTAVSTAAG